MMEYDSLEKTKSEWTKLVLMILVRNNPVEAVLTVCKMDTSGGSSGQGGSGPDSWYHACGIAYDSCHNCSTPGNS